ncbi:amylosucrase [Xanthomonas vasicola]|nr:alpha-amylase family protein [Xanthomonas vasicola]KFA28839.1 amylosucrase [Xanthomonas vasicola pv. vasculorum NCPPB 1326]KFA35218.1 amylosucrase [Xanthomonas vasicola pv. vasculorum NCPPB 1381]KFA37525.1 amylosucrase [Xanthomonas vasicola pv. vasculorum NCPPB 206]MBV6747579.1 alpha-amylase family protein [Xanthomonas vasicola pv. vasculorum NCPPB 890]MDO6948956.1 alpha-amylase family protein [Xanthomonas vasicola]
MSTPPIDSTELRAAFAAPLDPQRAAIVMSRYDQHAPRLLDALQTLYGQRADYATWLTQWLGALGNIARQRPHALHTLDSTRQAGWFGAQHMLGYSAYADRFAGTLQGVAERVPYLQELGVRYLHLLPFLRARAGDNDGGFAVSDYGQVEPSLGTNDDLVALTTRLREADISLCADFVLNHTADDHAWALAARAGDARYLDYYQHFADRTLPDQYESTLRQVFPHTAPGNFTWVDDTAQWMWTTFYPYQWDLNWSNPAVFGEMALAMLRLANLGVEAFRLDSTAYLWKRTGTDCMNQPEAHTLLVALRAVTDIVTPSVVMKAEAIVPMTQLPPYFGSGADQGHECHLAYHSTLMAAGWSALALQRGDILHNVIAHSPPLPRGCAWLSYVRCHDDIGWNVLQHEASGSASQTPFSLRDVARFYANDVPGSYARGESFQSSGDGVHGTNGMAAALSGIQAARESGDAAALAIAVNRLVLLYAIAFAMPGVPLIYMGDELAMLNDTGYRDDPHRQHEGRWLHRPAMDWQLAAQRHAAESLSGTVYHRLRGLIQQRAKLGALAADQALGSIALSDPRLFVLTRGDSFIAVHNFSDQRLEVELATIGDGWKLFAINDDVESAASSDSVSLVMPAYGVRWLQRGA